jgi:hypothetical protein
MLSAGAHLIWREETGASGKKMSGQKNRTDRQGAEDLTADNADFADGTGEQAGD